MGYAIAEELAARGADVELISGRTTLATPAGVRRTNVVTAEDMYRASVAAFATADAAIMCAAVADYTPAQVAEHKIKKGEGDMSIALKRTKDIAASLGEKKGSRVLIGFAMETQNERENAQSKLERKNFDFIVLNSLRTEGAGFRGDTNVVTLIDKCGAEELPLMSKREVAERIVDKIETIL
jgi:phosphopantothenoylcysteine decarboxylase/phosphopantothenate--cysteine ligase